MFAPANSNFGNTTATADKPQTNGDDREAVVNGKAGKGLQAKDGERQNRGGQIRTDDFLYPKQALYQAELRPAQDPYSISESVF